MPVVSEMLGHANPAITMSIYSHALPDSQALVADAMAEMFAGD
ncbi:MAG TPA: integrase [Dehalococcoidia bacterium]|nr:integrase [Dehalococcoidia bacterium]